MMVKISLPRWLRTRRAPTPADILVVQANAMRDGGDPASAAILYKRAIAMGAHSVGIRKQLANMLKDSGRFDEAFASYTLCLQDEPADSDTLLQLGHLFKMQGNIAQAVQYYTRAANGSPPSAHAMAELNTLHSAPHGETDTREHIDAKHRRHMTPTTDLHELIHELSARMDRLAERVALGNPRMSDDEQVSMQETRSNWYAFVPLFLNTASTIARMGRDIDALAARTEACERKLALQPPIMGTGP